MAVTFMYSVSINNIKLESQVTTNQNICCSIVLNSLLYRNIKRHLVVSKEVHLRNLFASKPDWQVKKVFRSANLKKHSKNSKLK